MGEGVRISGVGLGGVRGFLKFSRDSKRNVERQEVVVRAWGEWPWPLHVKKCQPLVREQLHSVQSSVLALEIQDASLCLVFSFIAGCLDWRP